MDSCPECGGVIIRRKDEKFCSVCGLVVEDPEFLPPPPQPLQPLQPPQPSQPQSVPRRRFFYFSSKEIHKNKLSNYVDQILDGYPKSMKERAKYLAIKLTKIIKEEKKEKLKSINLKAIAKVSAYAVLEEHNHLVSLRDLSKTERKMLRILKTKKLYKVMSPREKVERVLRTLCIAENFDFSQCLDLYYKYERELSRYSATTIAEVIKHLYCIVHNIPIKIKNNNNKKKTKVSKIVKKILKEEYMKNLSVKI